MGERIGLAVILAEDERSATFVRRYIKQAIDVTRIRVTIAPKGGGSAYDWVVQRYPQEVREQRIRVSAKNPNNAVLIAQVDADKKSVAERMRQLADALQGAGVQQRQDSERIAVCLPKRNIETWIHGLCEVSVDETYDYKRDQERRVATGQRKREVLCGQRITLATERLYALTRNNAPPAPESMPSVAAAVSELKRLER